MELIKVYRYENDEGEGPYNSSAIIGDILSDSHRDGKHPCWRLDFNIRSAPSYLSGCDSEQSLRRWFWKFNKNLRDEGFRVKTYLIPKENVEYGKSMKQLRFKK